MIELMDAVKMIVKVKYHSDIDPIVNTEKGDWYDLRSESDIFIPEASAARIRLGVSMELPEGYEAIIAPRSSMFDKFGLICTNSIGIIDNSYRGNNDVWQFPVYCLEGKDMIDGRRGTLIKKNTRICQFRIIFNQPALHFEVVDNLEGADRDGFGSTGIW